MREGAKKKGVGDSTDNTLVESPGCLLECGEYLAADLFNGTYAFNAGV